MLCGGVVGNYKWKLGTASYTQKHQLFQQFESMALLHLGKFFSQLIISGSDVKWPVFSTFRPQEHSDSFLPW